MFLTFHGLLVVGWFLSVLVNYIQSSDHYNHQSVQFSSPRINRHKAWKYCSRCKTLTVWKWRECGKVARSFEFRTNPIFAKYAKNAPSGLKQFECWCGGAARGGGDYQLSAMCREYEPRDTWARMKDGNRYASDIMTYLTVVAKCRLQRCI